MWKLTPEIFIFIVVVVLFYFVLIHNSREGFSQQAIFFNDLVKLGGYMRLGLGVPLTQGEKAALCDVAYRLPPPGGMPNAIKVAGDTSRTSLDFGLGVSSVFDKYIDGGDSLWMKQKLKPKLAQLRFQNKNRPSDKLAAELLTTSGTY